jgi:hypothetical protein
MASPAKLTVIFCVLGCLAWTAGVGVLSVTGWDETHRAIAKERDDGYSFCAERYGDPDAKARCIDLFDIQFVNERNSAIATRILVALLPFGALGFWIWWRRPRQPTKRPPPAAKTSPPPDPDPS